MTPWDFEGRWLLERRIRDRRAGEEGAFSGEAAFVRADGGLEYSERGDLALGGRPALRAERRYLWRARGNGADVLFADGRPFHRIEFRPGWRARHSCPPDLYEVRYDFSQWPAWRASWTVTGPGKDYGMDSSYSRPGVG